MSLLWYTWIRSNSLENFILLCTMLYVFTVSTKPNSFTLQVTVLVVPNLHLINHVYFKNLYLDLHLMWLYQDLYIQSERSHRATVTFLIFWYNDLRPHQMNINLWYFPLVSFLWQVLLYISCDQRLKQIPPTPETDTTTK